jgi:acetone carboxylase gamma subunit
MSIRALRGRVSEQGISTSDRLVISDPCTHVWCDVRSRFREDASIVVIAGFQEAMDERYLKMLASY